MTEQDLIALFYKDISTPKSIFPEGTKGRLLQDNLEHEVFDLAVANVITQDQEEKLMEKGTVDDGGDYFRYGCGFTWTPTPEGHDFWDNQFKLLSQRLWESHLH